MSVREDFRRWNDEMALRYNPDRYHRESLLPIRLLERRRVKVLLRQADVGAGNGVLEIGCGAGNVLEQVRGGLVIGVDLSRELLTLAAGRDCGAAARLAQSYGEALPFAASAFDRVICTEVLEHVPQPRAVCAEALRVLRPGGRFIFSVPNEATINRVKSLLRASRCESLIHRLSGYRFPADMTDEWHLHAFGPELALQVVRGLFRVEAVHHVPARLLSLRLVVSCCKQEVP